MNNRLIYLAIGLAGLVAIMFIVRQSAQSLPSIGGDQYAEFIYMGIWASLVGAAVISRPTSIGHTLKQLVSWVGIFLILMAAYAYRYELQDVASRVSGGLFPGSPISVTNANNNRQVTLIRSANGHFSARAQISGINVTFLVDTGASQVVLSNEDAARIGINVDQLAYTTPVTTANGITRTARTRIDKLVIGSISQRDVRAMVAQKGDLQDSLLGMGFINQLRSFEIRGDRMIFTQ